MADFWREAYPIILEVLRNTVLLFPLGFIYGATNFSPSERKLVKKIIAGLAIGFVGILVMMNPWMIDQGIFFDTRSVLLTVAGAFFGGISTAIAAFGMLIYRIAIGGIGVIAGSLTIVFTASLGLSWSYLRRKLPKMPLALEYYVLGLIAHIITILCQLAILGPSGGDILKQVWLPIITLFPFFTMILALAVRNQRDRLAAHEELLKQKILLQASIDATKRMEIFAIDANFMYLSFNEFHRQSIEKYYHRKVETGLNYLDIIQNDPMRERIKSMVDSALKGSALTQIVEVETTPGKFLEEHYTPIIDQDDTILGVTIFSHEITDRKQYQDSILYLSYHDALTGLHNRRFHDEELIRLDHPEFYPLSIVTCDVNGLKLINDAFGHDSGDIILQTFAKILETFFEGIAVPCRLGGDEFEVFLPNTNPEEAKRMISRLEDEIHKHSMYGLTLSASIGTASIDGSIPSSEVLKFAEDDMYKHKLYDLHVRRNSTIQLILDALFQKMPEERYHSKRVADVAHRIARAMDLESDDLDQVKLLGAFHDIGKINIDPAILEKPGALSVEEWASVKRHSETGYRILSSAPDFVDIAAAVLSHHEHYDGSGYPQGLKGPEIPLWSRILNVADAFDAMTSSRPYRPTLTISAAIAEIKRCSGTQFDPQVVEAFELAMSKKKIQ